MFDTADANNPGNIHEAMMEALHKFSSGVPDPPFTWLSVLNALELLGLSDYAEKLKFVIFRGELDLMKSIEWCKELWALPARVCVVRIHGMHCVGDEIVPYGMCLFGCDCACLSSLWL